MRAIFPGSFDPITIGHINLIERAAVICEKLYVVVAENEAKSSVLFSLSQRYRFVCNSCSNIDNVEVINFSGLIADCAKNLDVKFIIRGVRPGSDICYESNMASMNSQLAPGIETLLLSSYPEYSHISSSLVRQIMAAKGDARPFLPSNIINDLADLTLNGS